MAEIDWTSPTDGLAEQVERVESIISRENGQWGQLAATAPESPPPPWGDGG